MRTLLLILVLALSASYARAQDPASDAAQQAMQASQQAMQANQQAIQDMQNAQQAAQAQSQAAQQAAQDTTPYQWAPGLAATPKFSVKPGKYSAPVTVRIDDATRGAVIYYTTDGWTPTPKSPRYKGPITIDSSTTLQAVAVAPYAVRSWVAAAEYTIDTSAAAGAPDSSANANASAAASQNAASAATAPPIPADLKLVVTKGTPVPLVFTADVDSKTAQVGDKISFALANDLIVGGTVLAKKGAPATGTVIQVNKTGAGGLPGEIEFEADTLDANGTVVKLHGSAAKEGTAKPPNAAVIIPIVGPFTVLKHGTDAEIQQGAVFVAHVAADTPLTPPAN
jgi:hypothetical protein